MFSFSFYCKKKICDTGLKFNYSQVLYSQNKVDPKIKVNIKTSQEFEEKLTFQHDPQIYFHLITTQLGNTDIFGDTNPSTHSLKNITPKGDCVLEVSLVVVFNFENTKEY